MTPEIKRVLAAAAGLAILAWLTRRASAADVIVLPTVDVFAPGSSGFYAWNARVGRFVLIDEIDPDRTDLGLDPGEQCIDTWHKNSDGTFVVVDRNLYCGGF